MPDRIIRDELLASDRWTGLKRNTHRLAFVVLLLQADSLGNLEASEAALWRLWRDVLSLTDRQSVAEILAAVHDAGLIRLYEVDGKRYAHIPRFRQRLRYLKGRHPRPPSNIECNEIRELLEKSQSTANPQSTHRMTAAVEEKRSEVKRSEEKKGLGLPARTVPDQPATQNPNPQTLTQALNPLLEKLTGDSRPKRHMTQDEQIAYAARNAPQ